jgi:hypothetical protein
LNLQHANINFTCDVEEDGSLSFLDVFVNRNNASYSTSVYRKTTFTGLGQHFFSFVPKSFKINSIATLVNRAFSLSSSYINFNAEIEKLKKYFITNKYPMNLFEDVVNKFLNGKYNCVAETPTVPKQKQYITLPFYGHISYKIRNDLNAVLRNLFNHVDFHIILSNKFTIGSLFHIKENVPSDLRSCLIYNYQCSRCNARYIGSTIRSFKARRLEHMGRSINTGRPIARPEFSQIRQHSENCDHAMAADDFSIISTCKQQSLLLILESLFIKKYNPSLNSYSSSAPLYTVG